MRQTALTLALLFMTGGLFANPRIYYYRVDVKKNSVSSVKTALSAVEHKDSAQPYLNTHVLTPGDTNFNLIKMVPTDGKDFKLETKEAGTDLWQVKELGEDGFFRTLIDNSAEFPVSRDWSVKTSS